ncbi:MAG: helix-turn-helix transcriptional regulator [Prevotella salivae]|nr:helix-turn-helix transcriptional regulator [Segatella salivae]
MKDRIKMIMESQHMTQQTFAQFIQISPASLSSIFTGRTKPTLAIAEAIKSKLPTLSTDWLLFGSGPMYMTGKSDSESTTENTPSTPQELMVDFEEASNVVTTPPANQSNSQGVDLTRNNNHNIITKIIDNKQRKIVEIRVFYDDSTWETFVPQKS